MGGSEKAKDKIKWWQLSLFGVGCTIGTGFFLGSSIGIGKAGPSILIGFIIAALGTYFVFDGLARMTVDDPQKGAFRTYAKKAFGPWAGFSTGWVYWCSEMLIMGSQLTALSIFSTFWFPSVPLWVFATGYAILGIIVLLIGAKGLNKLENLFAVIKIAAILMFIILAIAAIFGWLNREPEMSVPASMGDVLPNGTLGLWTALIFAFYAFGGIEVMGLMATHLNSPKDAPKAGKIMILLLTLIYLLSIGLAVILVPLKAFNSEESPFIVALKNFDLAFVPHLFNGALIIAGFSTMVAALYGVTSILVTLAEDGDAPGIFAKKGKLKVPLPTLLLTVGVLTTSIVMAIVLPDTIYEYITTGAGLMLLYNWLFILLSASRLLPLKKRDYIKYYGGSVLIFLAVTGTLFSASSRPGFFISLAFVTVIGIVTLKVTSKKKKEDGEKGMDTLFEKLGKI